MARRESLKDLFPISKAVRPLERNPSTEALTLSNISPSGTGQLPGHGPRGAPAQADEATDFSSTS